MDLFADENLQAERFTEWMADPFTHFIKQLACVVTKPHYSKTHENHFNSQRPTPEYVPKQFTVPQTWVNSLQLIQGMLQTSFGINLGLCWWLNDVQESNYQSGKYQFINLIY